MATTKLTPRSLLLNSTSFTLPLRPRHPSSSSSTQSSHPPSQSQTRHASSARRTRKLLNIPPAASFGGPSGPPTGSSGRSRLAPRYALPQTAQMIFNPPSSAPNVYHTPNIFLPKEDVRRRGESTTPKPPSPSPQPTTTKSLTGTLPTPYSPPATTSSSSTTWIHLPPSLDGRETWQKSYHLQPEQIEEIRRLRQSDENEWTVRKLARHFHCSREFVTTVVLASKEKRKRMEVRADANRAKWGDRKWKTWLDRKKRRAMLERDE